MQSKESKGWLCFLVLTTKHASVVEAHIQRALIQRNCIHSHPRSQWKSLYIRRARCGWPPQKPEKPYQSRWKIRFPSSPWLRLHVKIVCLFLFCFQIDACIYGTSFKMCFPNWFSAKELLIGNMGANSESLESVLKKDKNNRFQSVYSWSTLV